MSFQSWFWKLCLTWIFYHGSQEFLLIIWIFYLRVVSKFLFPKIAHSTDLNWSFLPTVGNCLWTSYLIFFFITHSPSNLRPVWRIAISFFFIFIFFSLLLYEKVLGGNGDKPPLQILLSIINACHCLQQLLLKLCDMCFFKIL